MSTSGSRENRAIVLLLSSLDLSAAAKFREKIENGPTQIHRFSHRNRRERFDSRGHFAGGMAQPKPSENASRRPFSRWLYPLRTNCMAGPRNGNVHPFRSEHLAGRRAGQFVHSVVGDQSKAAEHGSMGLDRGRLWAQNILSSSPSIPADSACGRPRRPTTASATRRGEAGMAMCWRMSPPRAENLD